MSARIVLLVCALAGLAVVPALTPHPARAHAAPRPQSVSGCGGPLVSVYGASALKSVMVQAAQDFCNAQIADGASAGAAYDVEYSDGGTACVGVDFAADHPGADDVGASTVFAPACTGGAARPSSSIVDTAIGVNVVESIAQCPGANDLQGSSPHPTSVDVPCAGNGSGQNNQTFTAPNNESVQTAQLLWSSALGDYAQAGGTANNPPTVQQRIPGSGDRATWCQNLYGPGNDQCVGNATNTTTTGDELTVVCGNPYASGGPAAPTDGANAIGYASRAALVLDPRQPPGGVNALAGCGIVALNGASGYNRTCDPVDPSTFTPDTSAANPESGEITCKGDLDVATGAYPAWGYVHLDVNASSSSNAGARAFVSYVQTDETALLQQDGFMALCQMTVLRSQDAGPYVATTGATC